jgi:hypothetical protein
MVVVASLQAIGIAMSRWGDTLDHKALVQLWFSSKECPSMCVLLLSYCHFRTIVQIFEKLANLHICVICFNRYSLVFG